jgi:glutamate racemase
LILSSRDRVLFLDSGIGGRVYLQEFLRRHPSHCTAYLADDAWFPYGERSPHEVRRRVVELARAVADVHSLAAIVVACNTASVVSLPALRDAFSLPVVGTVPAVKPAAAHTRSGHIAILATNRTVRDPYTEELVQQFARLVEVTRLGLPRLVAVAERSETLDDPELLSTIEDDVISALPATVDTVVLACTHFVRLRPVFERLLGPTVAVVDSLDGVVNRLEAVLPSVSTEDHGTTCSPLWYSTARERRGSPWEALPTAQALQRDHRR